MPQRTLRVRKTPKRRAAAFDVSLSYNSLIAHRPRPAPTPRWITPLAVSRFSAGGGASCPKTTKNRLQGTATYKEVDPSGRIPEALPLLGKALLRRLRSFAESTECARTHRDQIVPKSCILQARPNYRAQSDKPLRPDVRFLAARQLKSLDPQGSSHRARDRQAQRMFPCRRPDASKAPQHTGQPGDSR